MKDKYLITHYLPLVAVVAASYVGFLVFPYDRALKMALTIATGVSYFIWGIIHHFIHGDLSFGIILEYLVISIFGISAILSLII